ncbi:MAG: phosphopantetheine-binding protein, partial [Candidatus Thiodiazotropha sp.]
ALQTPSLEKGVVVYETETEEALANIWSELLGGGIFAPHEHFFEVGGHSLLGVRLVARVREQFGVELPLRAVFDQASLAGMAQVVDLLRRDNEGGEDRVGPIRQRSRRLSTRGEKTE